MPMNYARRSIAGLLRLPPSSLVYRLLVVAFPRQAVASTQKLHSGCRL